MTNNLVLLQYATLNTFNLVGFLRMRYRFKDKLKFSVLYFVLLTLLACGQENAGNKMLDMSTPMPVSVITLEATSVPMTAEAVAQTEGAKEVAVRPRVGGIILKKMFEEGALVKAGQAMFLIDPEPYKIALAEANAQVAQQNARITQTQREADRLAGLLNSHSISQREYDNAISHNAIASANLQQANALLRESILNLSYTKVKASADGITGRFLYSEGSLVAANTSLLTTITQTSPIWVRFSLSDFELKQLGGRLSKQNVQDIKLILANGDAYHESGKLNFSAGTIDPKLGTQQMRATFNNLDNSLIPGQFVRVKVTTGMQEGVFLIPKTAVLTGEQGKFVFIVSKNDAGEIVASVRPIHVGQWLGNDWVVLQGLKTGDQVIVDHLIKIRPDMLIAPHPLDAQSSDA